MKDPKEIVAKSVEMILEALEFNPEAIEVHVIADRGTDDGGYLEKRQWVAFGRESDGSYYFDLSDSSIKKFDAHGEFVADIEEEDL